MINPSLRLRRAILMNDVPLVKRILKSNPAILQSPNALEDNTTSLHLAAKHGHEEICEILLAAGHEDESVSRTTDLATPLMLAVSSPEPNIEVIQLLLRSSPHTLAQTDSSGQNALMLAARYSTAEVIDVLLTFEPSQELDPESESSSSSSSSSSSEILPLNKRNSAVPNTPRQARLEGKLKRLEAMPFDALQIDAQDKQGFTAIHLASCNGNIDTITALLSHQANPLIPDKQGWDSISQAKTFSVQQKLTNLIKQYQSGRHVIFRPGSRTGYDNGSGSRPSTPVSAGAGSAPAPSLSGLGLSHVPITAGDRGGSNTMGPPPSRRLAVLVTRPSTASGGSVESDYNASRTQRQQFAPRNSSLAQSGIRLVTEQDAMPTPSYAYDSPRESPGSARQTPNQSYRPDNRRQLTGTSIASNASMASVSTVRDTNSQRGLLSGVRMRAASGDG